MSPPSPPLPLVPEPLALTAPVISMSTSAVSITMPPQPPCLLVPLTSSGPTVMLEWMASRLMQPLPMPLVVVSSLTTVMGASVLVRQMAPPEPMLPPRADTASVGEVIAIAPSLAVTVMQPPSALGSVPSALSVPLMVMGPWLFMRQMSPPPPCAKVPETSIVPSIVMAPLAMRVNQPLGPWSLPPVFTLMVLAEMVMTCSPPTSSMSPPAATTRSQLVPLNVVKSSVLPALTLARPVTVHCWVLVSQSQGWCVGMFTEHRSDIGVGGSVVVVLVVVVVVVVVVLLVVVVVVVSATAGAAPRASTTRRGVARRMPPAATRVPKGGAPGAQVWAWQLRRIAQGRSEERV